MMLISKTGWIAFVCILFFCSDAYGNGLVLSGKFGGLIFNSNDPGFTDYWASSGYLLGGRVSFLVGSKSFSLDIEDVKSEKSSYWKGWLVKTSAHILSIQLLCKQRLRKEGILIPYCIGGFGISRLRGTITVDCSSEDVSWDDFSSKFGIGFDLGRYIFLEAAYMSGGRNGNTGIALLIGSRYIVERIHEVK